ncbi:CAP domain-containing protein [Homoserinibacter sp. GY 40078]|uniref:CAP domain-containing protein n=1 Tax=Homoserinibacter sp. GY 40078 TaxID=2603275 RepID=UPI0021028414|nr:CAP domain-containing protein [Homoserinibacter sp. GY 40078]
MAAVLVSTVVAGGPAVAASETRAASGSVVKVVKAGKLLSITNTQRVARGLKPLKDSPALTRAACAWAQKLAAKRTLKHSTNVTSYRLWGENVAYGYSTSASVTNAWMKSPGHRANILEPRYTRMGACWAKSSNGTVHWVQQFGG